MVFLTFVSKPVWRFASHPRFPYWGFNMKQQHQLLSQISVYLQHHPGDANSMVWGSWLIRCQHSSWWIGSSVMYPRFRGRPNTSRVPSRHFHKGKGGGKQNIVLETYWGGRGCDLPGHRGIPPEIMKELILWGAFWHILSPIFCHLGYYIIVFKQMGRFSSLSQHVMSLAEIFFFYILCLCAYPVWPQVHKLVLSHLG